MPTVSIRRNPPAPKAIGARHKDGTVYLYGGSLVKNPSKQICLAVSGHLCVGSYSYTTATFSNKEIYTEIYEGDELVIVL